MSVYLLVFLLIIMTYGSRISGYLLLQKYSINETLRHFLYYIPGCLFVSLVIPEVFKHGVNEAVIIAVTAIIAYYSHNLFLCLGVGYGGLLLLDYLF